MAKQPRSLTRQGRRRSPAAAGGSDGRSPVRSPREGARVAIGDLDAGAAEAGRRRARRRRDRPAARRHRPRRLHRLPRRGRAAARPDRHARQQRRDHAGHAARRGGRREHHPPARDQPARGHPRHAGGDAAHAARAARGHIVNIASLAGRAGCPEPRHLLRDQARRHRALGGRARRAARHRRRGHGRDAGLRAAPSCRRRHGRRAASRRVAPEEVADEIVAALKVPRFDVCVPRSTGPLIAVTGAAAAPAARGRRARDGGRRGRCNADRAPRAAYEARAAAALGRAAAEEDAKERVSRPEASQSAIVAPISSPWSSCRKWPAPLDRPRRRGGRARRAKRLAGSRAAAPGPRRPTASASAGGPRAARRARAGPPPRPGASGACGISRGNARAPAFDAAVGNGAS